MQTRIGIIGGSGVYDIDGLEGAAWQTVETPWGAPSDQILTGTLGGVADGLSAPPRARPCAYADLACPTAPISTR